MFTELFVYILYINTSQTSFLFFQQSRVPFGTYFYLHFPRLRGGTGTYHRHAQDESQQDPTPIWPLPCTATALWRARRFVVSMRRAADCMCLKVCMLQVSFWFWQSKTVILSPEMIEVRHSFRFFAHVVCFSFRSIQVYVPQCFGFVSCGFLDGHSLTPWK